MKLLLFLLTSFLGLVASSPTNHTELATMKNMFYEMGIADPMTFKLVDRLVELAAIPHQVRDISNLTDQDQHFEGLQLYSIPQGEVRCHKDKQLDYMSVMAAVGKPNVHKSLKEAIWMPRGIGDILLDYNHGNAWG
ncbi:hypothetical protein O1611_g9982 [Lasiodiplodia mahajangana]|uniref:Uncharacterized protein n=1 Tax=Lasiodiplodia mahajangana TaxID=1108764 RepID=A0ACC2J389_9PEZI|nr:hypothetical protein O1611_g9982 [Lasiodiplodia mahajangana]